MAWVSAGEAQEHYGVSGGHLRAKARAGQIPRRGAPGRYEYEIPDKRDEAADLEAYGADSSTVELVERLKGAARPTASPEKRASSGGVTRIAWASDVHFPHEDSRVWFSFLRWLEDVQPDEVILGGDIMELESCSSHGGISRPALLLEEIDYTAERLDELAKAAPDARLTWLEGNHEDRLNRAVVGNLPTLHGAVNIGALLDFRGRGITWHKFGDIVHRGKMGFSHGWWAGKHVAAATVDRCGAIVVGHAHRVQTYSKRSPGHGVVHAYVMPTMERDPGWLKGKPHEWSMGWGYCEIDDETGGYQVSQILCPEGRAVWGGKVYTS